MTTADRGPRPAGEGRGPHLHWYLPTAGDGRDIVGWAHSRTATEDPRAVGRPPDLGYLADVARAAERLGFESVLTPTGTWCEDAWITTAALAAQTSTLTFIVALRPDSLAPTLAAQMAATFQRHSGGRLALNIVTGSDEEEQRRYGDRLGHDRRYERTEEFLRVLRGAWGEKPFDFEGEHYSVAGATIGRPLDGRPPTVYLGGASAPAAAVSARHADVHLAWGEPPDAVAAQLDRVRERAAALGRPAPAFGIRLHVITRDSAAEAWAEADRMLAAVDPAAIEVARRRFEKSTSVGQRRMTALTDGGIDRLEVAPNLWAGFALVRRHAGTALVGSHEQVAERIAEYRALGVDHFILSGQPHLEEAYTVGEALLPLVTRAW